jgi:hypothetical protein
MPTRFMKHVPFSKDLGQRLLDKGYSDFIIAKSKEDDVHRNPEAILTLSPCADHQGRTLPIKQMMEMPENILQQIYVMYKD